MANYSKGSTANTSFIFWGKERIRSESGYIETNKGQYLKLSGRNDRNIGKIIAFIDEKKVEVNIPEEDYYLVLTPIESTEKAFATGMIVLDRNSREIERIHVN